MKKWIIGLLLLAGMQSAIGTQSAASRKGSNGATRSGNRKSAIDQPNILVVMSDDQGAGDVGFAGNEWARTPVLDRLAAESAQFSNFIAGPACTPSRASFLTGRNFNHTGVWGVGPRGYIRRDETFLPEYLRRAGYRTAHFGKWGEGWTPDQRTYMRGYDEAAALGGGYQNFDPWFDDNGTLVQEKGWTTDLLADMTIDFIRRQTDANQPWYAITAYIAPHSPWECAPEFSEPLEREGYSKPLAAFYGMVAQMDAATGRILEELDRLGLADNTVVVFVSDNGATPVCERTGGTPLDSEDWTKRNALGLRGRKAMVWQNAIQVPCLVRWPGRIPPGLRTQLGAFEDLLPTILDLANVDPDIVPNRLPLHGISLAPVLLDPDARDPERHLFRVPVAEEGAPPSWPKLVIEDPRSLRYEKIHTSLVGPRFKFHSLPDGRQALYDLHSDPGEATDVSAAHPETAAAMAKLCRAEWDRLIESGRGFWMPPILVGEPSHADMKRCWAHLPPDVVPCNAAQRVTGTVTCPFQGLKGFSKAGDSAVFALEVRTAGEYRVSMKGDGLDRPAPLRLRFGAQWLDPKSVSAKEIEYGAIHLPVGPMELEIRTEADGDPVGTIQEIAILPTRK